MEMIVRTLLIPLICLCTVNQLIGQTDTLDRFPDGKDFQIDEKFRDRSLAWALNATAGIMYDDNFLFKYGIETSFEYKLSDSHSLGAGINLQFHDKPLFSNYSYNNTFLEIECVYRYYHNLKKRMSKGQTGNNFFANYFLLSPYLGMQYKPYAIDNYQWKFDSGIWEITSSSEIIPIPGLRLGYGLQRNIKGKIHFDINGGIQSRKWSKPNRLAELFFMQFSIGYILK